MARRRTLALLLAAAAGGLAWWQPWAAPAPPADEPAPAAAAFAPADGPAPAASAGPFSRTGLQARAGRRALAEQRLERAEQTLASYREATRYPPESRPLREHPDQKRPFDPITEDRPLRRPGEAPAPGVHLRTSQERVFASGRETVRLTVAAVDDHGQPLPLTVTRAVAFDLPDPRQAAGRPQVAIAFNDAGQDADLVGGDGVHSGLLAPAAQGFGDFAGTLRVQVELNQAGRSGVLYFDVIYQPLVPAEWGGALKERLADGSLAFDVPLRVQQAGRYLLSVRVLDAQDQPVALLTFNGELAAGAQTARLQLAGRLLRDLQPRFPLKLQDLDGFLLLTDQFPDRAMLPRRAGLVHTTQRYDLARFSDAEWQSEERSRYLTEYEKDVSRARADLEQLPAARP